MTDFFQKQVADFTQYRVDTEKFEMDVVRNDGTYRHITMRNKDGGSNCHFNITTTPGYLFFTGDMGCYIFTRSWDMFQLHRIDWTKDVPTVNYRYLSQKCQAVDKYEGLTSFDRDDFRSALRGAFVEVFSESEDYSRLYESLEADVIGLDIRGSQEGFELVGSWCDAENVEDSDALYEMLGAEGPFEMPSFHFKWACWAIADTIRRYDEVQADASLEVA